MDYRESVYYRGKRVSRAHYILFVVYERKYGVPVQLNQGRRTMSEQQAFWDNYRRNGWPIAAYPSSSAPHIKYGWANHANDINAGSGRGQAQHVAAYYRSLGIPVEFNVGREPWHMDTLDEARLIAAAKRHAAHVDPVIKPRRYGKKVVHLKSLMRHKGLRGFLNGPWYGPRTVRAIKRLQAKHGLKADGIVGPKTWRILHS